MTRPLSALLFLASAAVPSAAQTNLGGGITTSTDVEHFASISLDAAEMFDLAENGSYNDALNIYLAGKNSARLDRDGNELPDKRTLSEMSLDAMDGKFDGELPFVYQMHGLAGGTGHSMGNDADWRPSFAAYADSYVQEAFKEEKGTAGPEAAVALNLWMYAAHVLTVALEDCALEASGVNLDIIGRDEDLGGAESAIDTFIAFWIGASGGSKSDARGSLQGMTDRAAGMFGTTNSAGEANANENIKDLYREFVQILSFSGACREGGDSVEKLWGIAHRIVAHMQIPLIQLLIDAMVNEEQDFITLYAKAVVPQMSACRVSTYRRLKEALLDRTYEPTKFVSVLGDLQESYDCLGVSCEDIGAYDTDGVAQCADPPTTFPIAGYSPSSHVHLHSKIDLDVNAIKALLSFEDDKAWATAKDLYMYGKNSEVYRPPGSSEPYTVRSLQSLATSALRKKSPWYRYYEGYFNDPNYAETAVMDVFNGRGKWGDAPNVQKIEVLTKTIQYQILYMYLLAEAADAEAACRAGDKTASDEGTGVHAWDEVAAYYVGSLEGILQGGSKDFADGQLMWNVGNKRSSQFNTQTRDAYAMVNSEIEDDLYAGKGELDAYACDSLASTIRRIERNSVVPLIQSVLRYAIKMEGTNPTSGSKDLAEGETFALSILPIVKSIDEFGAEVLERNMIVEAGTMPVSDGAQRVADAFYMAMVDFELECELVGQSDGIDTCDMFRKMGSPASRPGPTSLWATVAVAMGAPALLACLWSM